MASPHNKMYYLIRSLLLITSQLLLGCYHSGDGDVDFYAFNNNLTLHRNFKITDYDSILIECGNINLTNRYTGEYYQLLPESYEIVGKGFNLLIDKIPIPPSVHPEVFARKVHKTHPLELSFLKDKLAYYKAEPIEFVDGEDGQGINMRDKVGKIHFAEIACSRSSDTLFRYVIFFNTGYHPK
ncbi:MAG TPA: hypothetical protein PLJ08_03265 [Cyclobacteriaceae bacterium]|nr:hypothetical protein [Cyclobacteriaceae bacterium]